MAHDLFNSPVSQGGYLKVLKHLHSEQIAKLNAKNQHECDLLEDIRSVICRGYQVSDLQGTSGK